MFVSSATTVSDAESSRVGADVPMIARQMFGTSDVFMDMVRQGYQPVYRPRLFEFREIVTRNGQVTQKVRVSDFIDSTFVDRAVQLIGPYPAPG